MADSGHWGPPRRGLVFRVSLVRIGTIFPSPILAVGIGGSALHLPTAPGMARTICPIAEHFQLERAGIPRPTLAGTDFQTCRAVRCKRCMFWHRVWRVPDDGGFREAFCRASQTPSQSRLPPTGGP